MLCEIGKRALHLQGILFFREISYCRRAQKPLLYQLQFCSYYWNDFLSTAHWEKCTVLFTGMTSTKSLLPFLDICIWDDVPHVLRQVEAGNISLIFSISCRLLFYKPHNFVKEVGYLKSTRKVFCENFSYFSSNICVTLLSLITFLPFYADHVQIWTSSHELTSTDMLLPTLSVITGCYPYENVMYIVCAILLLGPFCIISIMAVIYRWEIVSNLFWHKMYEYSYRPKSTIFIQLRPLASFLTWSSKCYFKSLISVVGDSANTSRLFSWST